MFAKNEKPNPSVQIDNPVPIWMELLKESFHHNSSIVVQKNIFMKNKFADIYRNRAMSSSESQSIMTQLSHFKRKLTKPKTPKKMDHCCCDHDRKSKNKGKDMDPDSFL